MSNRFGKNITITVFGESHGSMIGAVVDGFPSGLKVDEEKLNAFMDKRRAVGKISTARQEADKVEFVAGVKDGVTEGSPITLLIKNDSFFQG